MNENLIFQGNKYKKGALYEFGVNSDFKMTTIGFLLEINKKEHSPFYFKSLLGLKISMRYCRKVQIDFNQIEFGEIEEYLSCGMPYSFRFKSEKIYGIYMKSTCSFYCGAQRYHVDDVSDIEQIVKD